MKDRCLKKAIDCKKVCGVLIVVFAENNWLQKSLWGFNWGRWKDN